MGLIKKATDKPAAKGVAADGTVKGNIAAKMETDPGASAAQTETSTTTTTAASPAPAAAPAPSASTAVAAAPAAGAVTVGGGVKMMNVIADFKDKLPVSWNTLDRIQAINGMFVDKGRNNAPMGTVIQLQMLSWQDSYQISPGSDDEEAKELVRYSDDGITTTKGENIAEYISKLQGIGYSKAACDHRVLICGQLVGAEKDTPLEGELVQIDLSKTSKEEFDKYKVGTAFKIGKGMLTPEAALTMTMTAETANWKNRNWTIVKFSPTVLAA